MPQKRKAGAKPSPSSLQGDFYLTTVLNGSVPKRRKQNPTTSSIVERSSKKGNSDKAPQKDSTVQSIYFLDLPIEVRLQIYQHLFDAGRLEIADSSLTKGLLYPSFYRERGFDASILQTNKAVSSEASQVLDEARIALRRDNPGLYIGDTFAPRALPPPPDYIAVPENNGAHTLFRQVESFKDAQVMYPAVQVYQYSGMDFFPGGPIVEQIEARLEGNIACLIHQDRERAWTRKGLQQQPYRTTDELETRMFVKTDRNLVSGQVIVFDLDTMKVVSKEMTPFRQTPFDEARFDGLTLTSEEKRKIRRMWRMSVECWDMEFLG